MSKPTGTQSISHNAHILEDLFFAKQDAQLIKEAKTQRSRAEQKEHLCKALFLSEETADELLDQGIDCHTLDALTVIPLLAVAWSKHSMDQREKEEILRAAHHEGLEEGSKAHALLEHWLLQEPETELFATWKQVMRETAAHSSSEETAKKKSYYLDLSERVARTAGGFLGFGSISKEEQAILNEIDACFI